MSNNNCIWDGFTNKYSLSKTLRFELKPVGRTAEKIKEKGLISEDEERAKEYAEVKKIIDEYHKDFIERVLSNVRFEVEELEEFYKIYENIKKIKRNKEGKQEELERLQKGLFNMQTDFRKNIRRQIEKDEDFKHLFKKEFIQKILIDWLVKNNKEQNKQDLVRKFEKWTTYFTGFNENRKNVYSTDEIPTSVIYRIVHDNLPKFLDNVSNFQELGKYGKYFEEMEKNLEEMKEKLSEELEGKDLMDVFSLENFNSCLNQKGINRINNIIGGKWVEGEKEKRKGVNECVNLLSQKEQDKNEQKKIRSLMMTKLFKQILSDRESASFILDKFEDDKEVITSIKDFYDGLCGNVEQEDEKQDSIFESIEELFGKLKEFSLDKIYIKNDRSITDISQFFYSDYDFINKALEFYARKEKISLKNEEKPTKKEEKEIENWVKKTKYFSISEIENSLKVYCESNKKEFEENKVCSYFSNLKSSRENEEIEVLEEVKKQYEEVKSILTNNYGDGKKDLVKDEDDSGKIKSFLDSVMEVFQFIRPLYISSRRDNKEEEEGTDAFSNDGDFYHKFNDVFERLEKIIPLYNKVRNYVTQKPYSVEKFKLNFENPTLASGWDLNKESDNGAVLLKNGELFYLGVMSKGNNKIFKDIEKFAGEEFYEKMIYKLLPGASKMLPKVFFSKKNIDFYNPDKEILRIRNVSSHTKNGVPQDGYEKEDFSIDDCHKMIDFFKISIEKHPEWSREFNFSFSDTNSYNSIDEFYREVEEQGYGISFQKIDKTYIDKLVDEGKLYLFKIWNKDFSTKKKEKGTDNLHTLYWKALFDEGNLKDVVYKLNGEAELFYREKSIKEKDKIVHLKNKPIKNKSPIKNKAESKFNYDLIKDRRFTEDKFLFHCPITLNFKEGKNFRANDEVNSNIGGNLRDVHILSIDRGERHLAYYTLLNRKGEIVEQESFNIVKSYVRETKREFNYQEKLNKIEGDRDEARKNWKKIGNIKEMKEGYLSQVVHRIAKLIIEKNAIVVFEDLNFGFKRGRFKIEKQVYQKFERMLIEKLNYLVFKDKEKSECGGILKAYQLTAPFVSFQRLGKQSGVIFYVPAGYTSKICPKTGFVNLLYTKCETIEKSKEFFGNFKSIRYNKEEDYFEFEFNYEDFSGVRNSFDKDWVACSNGKKLRNFRNKDKNNQWDTEEVDVTEKLKEVLNSGEIDFQGGEDLKDKVLEVGNGDFFKDLMGCLRLVLQMRNSRTGTDEDYFLSCVKDENGEFFDSRKYEKEENPKFPKDADANGAYNIGLKGLMILDKIKGLKQGKKLNFADLKIDNKEFFEFVNKITESEKTGDKQNT